MLTAPRVYFAMADDGVFFRTVARVSERTRVPVVAIVLQGIAAAVIALSGTYRADPELRRLSRFHLLRPDRRGAIRLSPQIRRRTGRFPGAGPPRYDRTVRPRLHTRGGRDGDQQPAEQPDRLRHPARRGPCLCLLAKGQRPVRTTAVRLYALGQVQAACALCADHQRSPAFPHGPAAARPSQTSISMARATRATRRCASGLPGATGSRRNRWSPPTARRWPISWRWRR